MPPPTTSTNAILKYVPSLATASMKAYSMCAGQSSAAAETHATIVATQVIPFQSQSTRTVTTTVAGNTDGNTDGSHTTEHTTARATTTSSTSTPTRTSTTSTRSPPPSTESTLITAPPRSSTTAKASPPPTTSTNTKPASDTASAQTSDTSGQTQPGKGVSSLSVGQIVGISVGTAAALVLAIAISLYLRVVRRRRLMLVPKLTGDGKQGQSGWESDEEGFRRRFRPRTGHELQISVPVNLQAPARTSNSVWPPWQEKYKNIRTVPQSTQSTQNTQNTQNIQQAENRPEPPLKFGPPEILITRPTLERTPERAGVPDARNAINTRNLTPRTINGPPNGSPRGRMPVNITQTTRTTPTPSPTQNDVPPSLLIRPPPQRTTPARQPQETTAATPRPVPYPSYYGITPDDEPSFGYRQPQQPRYTEPVPVPVSQPTPRQPAQAQPTQQQRNLPSVFQPPLINRDSIVTEFAEDGEDDLSPRATDDGRYPSRRFSSRPNLSLSQQQYGTQEEGYAAGSHTYQQQQPQPSPRLIRQPLPQFQVQPHHQPQLRPQPPPRTPSPRTEVNTNTIAVNDSPQPFMSPSLVPRPLSLGPRNLSGSGNGNSGPITLNMPDGAGSNVSRMAKMRLGDERALGLRLGGDRRPQRPRQNAGWRRMDDTAEEY